MNAQELTKVVDRLNDQIKDLEKRVDYMEQVTQKLELFKRDGEVDIKQIRHEIDMLKRWRG